jgi:hypothetical protein
MTEFDAKAIEAEEIDADVHRRILDELNAARRPEDLDALVGGPEGRKLAAALLESRRRAGAFGFRDLRELVGIPGLRRELLDRLLHLFGRSHYGQWSTLYETRLPDGTPYHVAHAALTHTGKVLFLPEANTRTTLLWDPSDEMNPQFEFFVDTPDELLFCSGHAFLSDGRLLVAGGGGGGPSGVNRAWLFDPVAKTWTRTMGDMGHARWYPTVIALGDERHVWVVGGAPSNDTSEVYDEWSGTFAPVGGAGAQRSFPQLYPGLHLLPGGEVFYSRTGFGSAGQGPGGGDPNPSAAYFRFTSPTTGEWVPIADAMEFPDRVRGMSVLLLDECHGATVTVIGGTALPGSETAESIGLATLTPGWDHAALIPGATGRINVNAVLLPDGRVFVCGGTADPASPSAQYDPETGTWSAQARANYRKQYHSVAVLLPSAKVMATGGSNYGGGSNVIEVFSPPYLFRDDGTPAARPQINDAPELVHHGDEFAIQSPQAADVRSVVLVRPMAVTHQTDTEQRRLSMPFTASGTTLTVYAPNHHHPHGAAPRGWYMLFLVDGAGVPSVARFMLLH